MRLLGWLRQETDKTDWQALVDAVGLAAVIGGAYDFRWRAEFPFQARIVSDHYHASINAGNLSLDAIDAELFALDAAIASSEKGW